MTRYYASYRELDRDIRDGRLYPVYFFYGENDYLIRRYEGRLTDAVTTGGGLFGELLATVFWAGEDSVTDVLNAAMTIPMGGGRKVVVFREAERLKEKEVAALVSYAQSPSERTILLVTARGVGKGRGASGIAAPPSERLNELAAKSVVAFFPRARETDVREWVAKKFADEGKEIDHEALDVIVDFVGQDLWAVSMEIEKILIFMGDEKRVTLAHVEEILPNLRVHTVFELTDALSRGDPGSSVEILREVTAEGADQSQILSTIRWHFMRLWRLKVMLDAGIDEGTVAQRLKIPSFRISEYAAQARRIPHDIFRRAFGEFYRTDRSIKSRSGKGTVVMDRMVLAITTMMRTGRYTSG
jgi:DNA polymerase-3 subunit delta